MSRLSRSDRESTGRVYYPPEFWTDEPSDPIITLREVAVLLAVFAAIYGIACLWFGL